MDEKQRKIEETKKQIINDMKSCMDSRGVLNITEFRNKYRKEYGKLPIYFGSVDKALEVVGAVKVTNQKNTPTFQMRLALDYLNLLTSQGNSVASIARKYGVSRANVNQLYHRLQKVIEVEA
jgi:transposase-like protein